MRNFYAMYLFQKFSPELITKESISKYTNGVSIQSFITKKGVFVCKLIANSKHYWDDGFIISCISVDKYYNVYQDYEKLGNFKHLFNR